MQPKPTHLQRPYAEQFQDQSVVAAYPSRPPYPPEAIDLLLKLGDSRCRAVLDIGCGTGEIARFLAGRVGRVDAVDFSPAMIAKGRTLPGGDHPNLTWVCGAAEDAPLSPPYGLVTAAASLHWMEWQTVLPRLRQVLTPDGCLAIIEDSTWLTIPCPALVPLVRQFSTNQDYQPYHLVRELEDRHLFQTQGRTKTAVTEFVQPVAHYIESFHARNGFSRERMKPEAAAAFDREVEQIVSTAFPSGTVVQRVAAEITWGKPL